MNALARQCATSPVGHHQGDGTVLQEHTGPLLHGSDIIGIEIYQIIFIWAIWTLDLSMDDAAAAAAIIIILS